MTGDKKFLREIVDTPLVPEEAATILGLEGRTLEGEFTRIMELLAGRGVEYPAGYLEILIQKYHKSKVLWPRMMVSIGDPSIRKHKHYQEVLQNGGSLLDYGCGTGDDLRAIVSDGFLQQHVRGFDINWASINLGFDLYRDREAWARNFFVADSLQFPPPSFDYVYSGAVLHALFTKKRVCKYIANACSALKPGGVFFGYTMGFSKELPQRASNKNIPAGWGRGFLKFLTADQLYGVLKDIGFNNIDVDEENGEYVRLWFYAKK